MPGRLHRAPNLPAFGWPFAVMIASLACFDGNTLVILGGADPQAKDFAALLDKHDTRVRRVTITGANHSFTSREWRDEVAETCASWIVSW